MDPLAAGRFDKLAGLYEYWNARINVISRKDLPNLYVNHVLHSLSLAKVIPFGEDETVLDIGTGGGFPGIPLAIMFPLTHFTLIDSTAKKVRVVDSVSKDLGLANVSAVHVRAEDYMGHFHYVVSRAVSSFSEIARMSADKLSPTSSPLAAHGIYCLKGGDLQEELGDWKSRVRIFDIGSFFDEEYFNTKKIVFLPSGEIKRGAGN